MTNYKLFLISTALVLLSFTSCNDSQNQESKQKTQINYKPEIEINEQNISSKKITFELIRTFKHDKEAFTQGLLYSDGYLYESTGLNGKSSLRKINYKTGEIITNVKLESKYFAEGLELVGDKFYLLTYKSGICLTYDKNYKTLPQTFQYNGEGWGLTFDGNYLIKSNGTNILEFVSPNNFSVVKKLDLKDEYGNPLFYVNEMEFINGKIWANIWGTGSIVIINPQTGNLEQRFDFTDLFFKQNNKETTDVLNGIAYIKENNSIILTGKNWDTFFEYKIIEE